MRCRQPTNSECAVYDPKAGTIGKTKISFGGARNLGHDPMMPKISNLRLNFAEMESKYSRNNFKSVTVAIIARSWRSNGKSLHWVLIRYRTQCISCPKPSIIGSIPKYFTSEARQLSRCGQGRRSCLNKRNIAG